MPVTAGGMHLLEMRLLHHGGQVLLLVVVAGLAGAVVLGVALERNGLPAPVANRAASLLAPPKSSLPPRIRIASAGGSAPLVSAATATPEPASPSPTTAVVPNVVYTYPPDEHGRGGSSGGGGGGHRGPG